MKNTLQAATLAALLAMGGCGLDHKANFGGGGLCSTGAEVAKDTSNPIAKENPAKPLDTLRVASFNMSVGFPVSQLLFITLNVDSVAYNALDTLHTRYLRGKPGERLKAMARAIVALDLDVVGLQEVETLARDGVLENDFIQELVADIQALNGPAYQTRYKRLNDTVLDGAKGGKTIVLHFSEGDAMLIKPGFQILDSADVMYFNLLPFTDSIQVQRAYNYVRLRSPKGTFSQVYNTHLEVFTTFADPQISELSRQAACRRLPGHAQIVLGDFNVDPGTEAHSIMTEAGYYDTYGIHTDSTVDRTCCVARSEIWSDTATFSNRRIDFIMAKGITKVVEAKTALAAFDTTAGVFASDHRMVTAVLEMQ